MRNVSWLDLVKSPVTFLTLLSAGLIAAVGAFDAPGWLLVTAAMVAALAAGVNAFARVTRVKAPKNNDGVPLVPKTK